MTDELQTRPIPLQVRFDTIPGDLRELNQWVLWRYEWKKGKNGSPGKWDKPPYIPDGSHASATDPTKWNSFDRVKSAYESGLGLPVDSKKHFDGIGFVANRDTQSDLKFTLIDLDKCVNQSSGEIEPWAKEIIDAINSYTEISPSGTGIRIIAAGSLLPEGGKGRKKGHVEIYQTGRYLTITGHELEEYPSRIEERIKEINNIYKEYFVKIIETEAAKCVTNEGFHKEHNLTDEEVITLATSASNGDKFRRLMDGDTSSYPSASEADEALCCILAFYSKDPGQIERIWGQSGLGMREKFGRRDYREKTIKKALEMVKDHYHEGNRGTKSRIKRSNKRKSIATKLVELAKNQGCELWHTSEGEPYISFDIKSHKENHLLRTKAVRRWLGKLLYDAESTAANAQAVEDAITTLEAEAIYEGPEYPASVRVGEWEDAIYLDLCDDRWRAVKIDSSDWRVVADPPIKFIRSKGMLPLPEPAKGGSLEALRPLLNVTDKNWILIKGILVGALNPRGPYPVVIFGGEQGSAKSTTQRIIRNLIDPNDMPLRRPPRDERDLMIAAINSWIISFDNLSGIPMNLSDALCTLSTGGGLSTRELYTDKEETLLSVQKSVFLNGIDSIPSRHDLLDRSIIITLLPLDETRRKTEKEISEALDSVRPGVLGALCGAVSIGLRNFATTKLPHLPRMADFAKWVASCEEGLECERDSFMATYLENQDKIILDNISLDPLAQYVMQILEQSRSSWSGTANQLLETMNRVSGYIYNRPPMGWPQTPSSLSNKLNRLAPALRKIGIEIDFGRTAKTRYITIRGNCKGMTAMTANDDDLMKGRHEKKPLQETINAFSNGHNDGDDGVFLPFNCEKRKGEKEERGVIREERVEGKDRHRRHSVISEVNDSDFDVTAKSHEAVIPRHERVIFSVEANQETSINAELKLGQQRKREWEEHFKTPEKDPGSRDVERQKSITCPVCEVDIGPGHSSRVFEGVAYCTSCAAPLSMIRASAKALAKKNGVAPSTLDVFFDIASKGRPPKKEHLPAMLMALGFTEKDGRWDASHKPSEMHSFRSNNDTPDDTPKR